MSSLGCRARFLAVLAVAVVFAGAIPSLAAADPPHSVHFGGQFRGGHFAAGHPAPRAGGWQGHGRAEGGGGGRWHAGFSPGGGWDGEHGRGGDWRGRDWGDGHWHGDDWGDGHWPGGEWDDRYWTGRTWWGGDWDGLYWPPVDYGWDYPWYLRAVPYGAVTLWFGGVPYYYLNRMYYVWSPYYDGYVVTDPPPVASRVPSAPGTSAQNGRGVLSLEVIPRKGQSEQQTANDRYACHRWAVAQSGFDPINPAQDAHATSALRAGYRRALTACLNARGYSVRMPPR